MYFDSETDFDHVILKQVDKYQVEVATSTKNGIIVPSALNDRVDISVDTANGKIIIEAKTKQEA